MKRSLNILALLLALVMMLSACAGKAPDAGDSQAPADSEAQAETGDNSIASEQNDIPAQSEDAGTENNPQQEAPQDPSVAPQQNSTQPQNDVQTPDDRGSYEEYLSALTLFALSMDYPDFQLQGIYAASSVSLAQKTSSKGIYVFFDSMGESLCAHITHIEAERISESGTTDLFANELGFSSFELMSELPDTNSLTLLDSKVYGALLSELTGISIFSH